MKYLLYLLKAKYRKGRGIHSPYLFSFISEAVFNATGLVFPDAIKQGRHQLLMDRNTIRIQDLGAGSRRSSAALPLRQKEQSVSIVRTIASMARHSSVNGKSARLLHRISAWYEPTDIIELGTGLGLSTACLAFGCPEASLVTVEGSEEKAGFARRFLHSIGVQDASVITGRFDDVLPGLISAHFKKLLVFVDGNHQYEATMRYIDLCVHCKAEEILIVMDDIYWSEGMERAWRDIKRMEEVRVSIDVFFHGILLLKKELHKQDLVVRF